MTNTNPAVYLGLDVETTGLDPHAQTPDIILEIGLTAFDAQLNPLNSTTHLVNAGLATTYRQQGHINSFVENMHTTNNLWADLEATNPQETAPELVEATIINWIDNNNYAGLPMLGSSITLDRTFLADQMPNLLAKFHYRSVDATTLCLLLEHTAGIKATDHLPPTYGTGKHRVLADINDSATLIKTCLQQLGYTGLESK